MAYEYKVGNKKVVLDTDTDVVAVRFKEPAPHSLRASVSRNVGLGEFAARYELPGEPYTVIPVAPTMQPREERRDAALMSLRSAPDVDRATQVFRYGDTRLVATSRVLAGIDDPAVAKKLFSQYDCTVLRKAHGEYELELPPTADPLEVASKLSSEPGVDYAEPDFVSYRKHLIRRDGPGPNTGSASDPESGKQYAITITKAVQAWEIQKGAPEIAIAVLDEGVDTYHEDLAAVIKGAYDGMDDDTFQEPNAWDGHGTACAGLAAAVHDNARGIRGIGGGCSLKAVRIAASPSPGASWRTSNAVISRSIDWAWENGADVLSNSWGGGAPSSAIINAFERARTQGRDGKGCVIVVAAGNESSAVSFPGDQPNMLTVSASNEFDEFKTKTSADGETWWGSNFGPEVDVAAPGVHNWTTDIMGSSGYTSGHYTDFNGTSSATPIVAGACALLLSANPSLTESEVRSIICKSADKVGSTPYVNGRNDQFGFGRLNCLAAVQLAAAGKGTYWALHRATKAVQIRDKQTCSLPVAVGDTMAIRDIKVHVEIAHTYIGDLQVKLIPPTGAQPIVLHSKTGGGQDNLVTVYNRDTTPALEGLLAMSLPGQWVLEVTDTQNLDEGAILSFAVELLF